MPARAARRRGVARVLPADREGLRGRRAVRQAAARDRHGIRLRGVRRRGRYLGGAFRQAGRGQRVSCRPDRAGPHRQASKFRFLETFCRTCCEARAAQKREIILCGDWNIAHQAIDLKNWRSNQKQLGFLPEERAWLTQVFDELGFVDVFRARQPGAEQYTWWSNRGQAWAKNVRLAHRLSDRHARHRRQGRAVSIYKKRRFSDHAPLIVDYDLHACGNSAPAR